MKFKHNYTSDEKLKWWGYGEWVEEPDEVKFTHQDIKCLIGRIRILEHSEHCFGGYLVGYLILSEQDGKLAEEMNMENILHPHGGITYSEWELDPDDNKKNLLLDLTAPTLETIALP